MTLMRVSSSVQCSSPATFGPHTLPRLWVLSRASGGRLKVRAAGQLSSRAQSHKQRGSALPTPVGPLCTATVCTADRGVGYIPNRCTDSEFPDYDAGLCYKRWVAGYTSRARQP